MNDKAPKLRTRNDYRKFLVSMNQMIRAMDYDITDLIIYVILELAKNPISLNAISVLMELDRKAIRNRLIRLEKNNLVMHDARGWTTTLRGRRLSTIAYLALLRPEFRPRAIRIIRKYSTGG